MENGNKLLAAISYIWILCIVTILCAKDDAFARYHANQGLVLLIANIASVVAGFILGFIPFVGGIISWIISIALFVLMILGIVNAATGKMKPLPLIGGIEIIK
ncbi:MAG: hypothetical protein IJF04_06965 [Oscillospiraceae bacterium]|nr:hypothetical protein [Oscillospiraceae bacterium]MBQ2795747.1 hypothetical protein [Oscillospiraceae bacterium]MBQ3236823.1 hypothetical protein [Oscillospiraceae bacterium]MBQ3560351.1 hypothetical protein [Oscillospiraceae bacterium]